MRFSGSAKTDLTAGFAEKPRMRRRSRRNIPDAAGMTPKHPSYGRGVAENRDTDPADRKLCSPLTTTARRWPQPVLARPAAPFAGIPCCICVIAVCGRRLYLTGYPIDFYVRICL